MASVAETILLTLEIETSARAPRGGGQARSHQNLNGENLCFDCRLHFCGVPVAVCVSSAAMADTPRSRAASTRLRSPAATIAYRPATSAATPTPHALLGGRMSASRNLHESPGLGVFVGRRHHAPTRRPASAAGPPRRVVAAIPRPEWRKPMLRLSAALLWGSLAVCVSNAAIADRRPDRARRIPGCDRRLQRLPHARLLLRQPRRLTLLSAARMSASRSPASACSSAAT